jgi:adenylate kinase family enzyme
MLIVEGPDGSGKTTLIRRLMEDLRWPVAPRVVSQETQKMVDLKEWTEINLTQGLVPTIFDRHRIISEPIYGPIIRRSLEEGFDSLVWTTAVFNQFDALDPFVIWCLPPRWIVEQNVWEDENNVVVKDDIGTIYDLYHFAAARCQTWNWVWDYTADPAPRYYEALLRSIRSWGRTKGLMPS